MQVVLGRMRPKSPFCSLFYFARVLGFKANFSKSSYKFSFPVNSTESLVTLEKRKSDISFRVLPKT